MKAKVVPPFVVRVRFTHSVMSREGCSGGKQGEREKKETVDSGAKQRTHDL